MGVIIASLYSKLKKSDLIAWVFVFIITSFIIIFIQFIALPYIFPAWHAGDGLLVGGDWLGFHREAVKMAVEINTEGWSEWELMPKGWMPAGVAGAIYALSWPKPWTLIPLNAAVHATTFIIVMNILLVLVPRRSTAFLASMAFVFFPSAMLWYTQIHRDGYQILGTVLFLYGMLLIVSDKQVSWKTVANGFALSVLGVFTIWLVRPHSIVILQYMLLMLILLIAGVNIFFLLKGRATFQEVALRIIVLLLLVGVIVPLTKTDGASKYQSDFSTTIVSEDTITQQNEMGVNAEYEWIRTTWLPQSIDNHLYSIAYLRAVTYQERYGETASGIDYDRSLHSAYDFMLYLPRALQIAFLAPFPNEWFGEGSLDSTTFFRRVSALEMLIIYLSLPFLVYAIYKWHRKLELWVTIIFCTIMMLPLVYSVPNVGTLYRYRYGYLMLLVGLGLAVMFDYIIQVKKNGSWPKSFK